MNTSLTLRTAAAGSAALIVGMAMTLSAALAQEPDWTGDPSYGAHHLSAGFTPDPWTLKLQAGGSNQVNSNLGPSCTGYIMASAPDVDLYYTAGSLPLYIGAESQADTTLVINGPDGRWYCNDDFIGLNPLVMFQNPPSGLYSIWVGVHGSSQLQPATLQITELNPVH